MSRRGDCLVNAMAESFFATLEHELLRFHLFASRSDALDAVAHYIENFYNPDRLHSALDYRSPIEYELTTLPRRRPEHQDTEQLLLRRCIDDRRRWSMARHALR